ncbi:MAG: hypothetical protein WCS96_13210 [Victivallales bacterium]|jgi:hypothetical protein
MKLRHLTQSLSVFILLSFNLALFSQALPKNAILYEAENYHIKQHGFAPEEFLHVSGGKFIAQNIKAAENKNDVEIFRVEFPSGTYTVWACSVGIDLGIAGPLLGVKKVNTMSAEWQWHNMGTFSEKQMGNSCSIMVMSSQNNPFPKGGLDCVILAEDAGFIPKGVYAGYSPDAANMTLNPQADKRTGEPVESIIDVKVFPERKGYKISKYLASANAHGLGRHIIDNPEWDATMESLFSKNILAPLFNVRKTPDESGLWWDFKEIDEFVLRAKQRWHVDELLMFPAWWLNDTITGKRKQEEYTQEDLDKGEQVIMQLVNRYARPGPLYCKYWVLEDEWPGTKYWQDHPRQFAEYYAQLLRKVKSVNPDVKVGGPVDCWPQDPFIAIFLKYCPEIDFIAWNMFTTGRPDTPLKNLFHGAARFSSYINSSRQLGEKILNRELPVMVTSYGPNFHAWDPPDFKLAQPVIGTWNALVLSYMAEAKCFSGMSYNVRAADCGLFGPSDPYAIKSKMLPPDIDKNIINIRPAARVVSFFKNNISGGDFNEISSAGDKDEFSVIAASKEKEVAIVIVNYSDKTKNVNIAVEPYERTAYSGFQLPDEFLYCDEHKVSDGRGLLFSEKGTTTLEMPAYSTWCLKLRYKK